MGDDHYHTSYVLGVDQDGRVINCTGGAKLDCSLLNLTSSGWRVRGKRYSGVCVFKGQVESQS